jgi:hypothetical protein
MRCPKLRLLSRVCLGLVLGVALGGCSPELNWRTVRSDLHPLQMLLPCKPDTGRREVPMAGIQAVLDMQGCEAGGATFAVSHVRLVDAARAEEAMAGWKTATLANLRASGVQEQSFAPPGSALQPPGVRLQATGQRQDGQALNVQAVWFARSGPAGVDLFHALVLADKPDVAVADTFFAGLKLQ